MFTSRRQKVCIICLKFENKIKPCMDINFIVGNCVDKTRFVRKKTVILKFTPCIESDIEKLHEKKIIIFKF